MEIKEDVIFVDIFKLLMQIEFMLRYVFNEEK